MMPESVHEHVHKRVLRRIRGVQDAFFFFWDDHLHIQERFSTVRLSMFLEGQIAREPLKSEKIAGGWQASPKRVETKGKAPTGRSAGAF